MHNSLFPNDFPVIPDAQVSYDGGYYAFAKAYKIQSTLLEQTPWRQNKIKLFNKMHNEPRLSQIYGDEHISLSYSGITHKALPWTPLLKQIKKDLEKAAQTQFNVCLINRYRNGQDSMGWHADDESYLGKNPIIASLTLGQERFFHLKHNTNKEYKFKFLLEHGSLLIMAGATQHNYKHQIAKTQKPVKERINLTFRKVIR